MLDRLADSGLYPKPWRSSNSPPQVFACLQKDEGLGCSNSGFVHGEGGVVIDTFWDLALSNFGSTPWFDLRELGTERAFGDY